MSKRIVLDANILIRAILGVRVSELLVSHADEVSYFTPEVAFEDAAKFLPVIAERRGADPAPWLQSLDHLKLIVETVPLI